MIRGTFLTEGASVIFAKASSIASQLYYAAHSYIALRAVLKANIISLKPQGFNITLRDKAKYHCETCLTISLIVLIFEIG